MQTNTKTSTKTNINALSQPLVEALISDAKQLNIKIVSHESGATIVDAAHGNLEAGRRIAEICMGGLGVLEINPANNADANNFGANYVVKSRAQQPVLACLASQYAGWALESNIADKVFCTG